MKIGFIGVGKIARAIVQGLCTSVMRDLTVKLSPRNEKISKELARTISNVDRMENNQLVLDESDVIFITVRPNISNEVLTSLKCRAEHTIISLVPFLSLSDLAKGVEPATRLSRAIPLPTVTTHNCPIPILNSNKTVTQIFSYIGQPLLIDDENQLHTLWALTGFIAPFYELLGELSDWATSNGVKKTVADRYVVDMFQSLSLSAQKTTPVDFNELVKHATTPNGMNEQAGREVRKEGAHAVYTTAASNLLRRFLKHI
jgi:pyrroline-5-carboxylate reductase